MPYTTHNYRTKKEIKLALAAGTKITCFQPGPDEGWIAGKY